MLHFYLLLEVRSSCSVTCAATKRTNVLEILIPDPSSSAFTPLLVFLTVGIGWEDFTAILDGKVDEFCSRGFCKMTFTILLKALCGVGGSGISYSVSVFRAGRRRFTSSIVPAHTQCVCVSVQKL